MTPVVHVVDYGAGNLFSVARAIEKAGGEARLTNRPAEVAKAERLLLPGVGAYQPCMQALKDSGLAEPVLEFARMGRPFLGICVGMQLLFDHGLEFGRHDGLGLIAGHVAPIAAADDRGTRKIPHIGWSALGLPDARRNWHGSLLEDARPGLSSAYFVHSFNCLPDDPARRLAEVDYAGHAICAAVEQDNITAFQCHPEKSGAVGLRILERFLRR